MMENARITVAVVEDDPLHRERFRDNLGTDPALELVAEYGGVAEAIAALADRQPDVLLVDLGLPDGSGFDVIAAARRVSPATEIMVVSVFGGEDNLLRAVEAGATGYLLKDSLPQDFNAAIHALRAGESPISPALARLLLKRYQPAPAVAAPQEGGTLSRREVAILELVARGIGFAEVAETLFISPHTVKTHVKNIYRKLDAHSRPHAVYIARQRGLIAS
ncbi:response regulator [Ferrovibrio sp.]|uniref:response regulator n=1 Tax=Ferrovibrio sp. TaxID=1917215 RepID=UPI003D288928